MLLLPTEPGPPLGLYQKELVSLTVFGLSVSTEPEKLAERSAVPQPLPNTKPPPCCGVSKTFMYPSHEAPGLTPTVTCAFSRPATIRDATMDKLAARVLR